MLLMYLLLHHVRVLLVHEVLLLLVDFEQLFLLALNLLLVGVEDVCEFLLILYNHQSFLQPLLSLFIVFNIAAQFFVRTALHHKVLSGVVTNVILLLLVDVETLEHFSHCGVEDELERGRVFYKELLKLLLTEVFLVHLVRENRVKVVDAVRLKLDTLNDFLCEKFLLSLLALAQQDIIKSLLNVLGQLIKLKAESLDQYVIIGLDFGESLRSGLMLEEVRNQQRLYFGKMFQRYNLIDELFNLRLFLELLGSLDKVEDLVECDERAFVYR